MRLMKTVAAIAAPTAMLMNNIPNTAKVMTKDELRGRPISQVKIRQKAKFLSSYLLLLN